MAHTRLSVDVPKALDEAIQRMAPNRLNVLYVGPDAEFFSLFSANLRHPRVMPGMNLEPRFDSLSVAHADSFEAADRYIGALNGYLALAVVSTDTPRSSDGAPDRDGALELINRILMQYPGTRGKTEVIAVHPENDFSDKTHPGILLGAAKTLKAHPRKDEYIPALIIDAVSLLNGANTLYAYGLQDRDALTGLKNRYSFNHALAQLQSELERLANGDRRTRLPLSVVMFDLDHFKSVNDSYGHRAGDEVLSQFAEMLASVFRLEGAYRLSGEEFAVIVDGVEPAVVRKRIDELRAKVANTGFIIPGHSGPLKRTFSAGIYSSANAPELLAIGVANVPPRADKALYEAKRHGRDRTVRHSELMCIDLLADAVEKDDDSERRSIAEGCFTILKSGFESGKKDVDNKLFTLLGYTTTPFVSLMAAAVDYCRQKTREVCDDSDFRQFFGNVVLAAFSAYDQHMPLAVDLETATSSFAEPIAAELGALSSSFDRLFTRRKPAEKEYAMSILIKNGTAGPCSEPVLTEALAKINHALYSSLRTAPKGHGRNGEPFKPDTIHVSQNRKLVYVRMHCADDSGAETVYNKVKAALSKATMADRQAGFYGIGTKRGEGDPKKGAWEEPTTR